MEKKITRDENFMLEQQQAASILISRRRIFHVYSVRCKFDTGASWISSKYLFFQMMMKIPSMMCVFNECVIQKGRVVLEK